MPQVRTRVLIFDLDEALLDRRNAWQYAIEESIAAACGQRVSARDLVAEYRRRPWRHALSVLVPDRRDQLRCEDACIAMYERSAMKRLLVHEGLGVALDHVRANRVEMGAISREPHRIAIRQIQSTGLDRFLAVLSPTPERAPWEVAGRLRECLAFLDRPASQAVFVGADARDLDAARAAGLNVAHAAYAGPADGSWGYVESPAELVKLVAGLERD